MQWMSACISSLRDALVGGGDPELTASLSPSLPSSLGCCFPEGMWPAGQFACINMKFNTVHLVALLGS